MDFPDTDETRACTIRGLVSSETTTTTNAFVRSFVSFARLDRLQSRSRGVASTNECTHARLIAGRDEDVRALFVVRVWSTYVLLGQYIHIK